MADKYQLDRPYQCCSVVENLEPVFFVTQNSVQIENSKDFETQANIAVASMCTKCGFINDSESTLIYLINNKKLLNLLNFEFKPQLVLEIKRIIETEKITKVIFNGIEPLDDLLRIIQELNLTIVPANDHNTEKAPQA